MIHRWIFTWDWKDQPPWEQINEALADLGGPALCSAHQERQPGCPQCYPIRGQHVYPVPDTGGDQYAIIVAERGLTGDDVQNAYDEWALRS